MIRQLRLDDLETVVALDKLALRSNWFKSDYKFEIEHESTLSLGVELEEELIGIIIFRKSYLYAELYQLMIDPDYQGKGYGKKLMHEAERLLLLEDIESLFLEVRETNDKAISLYKKIGFITLRKRKDYYGLDQDGMVMGKRLVL